MMFKNQLMKIPVKHGEWVKINKEDIDFGDEAEDKAEEAGDKKYSLDDVDVKTMPDGSKVYLHTDENGKTTEIDPSEIDGLESSDEADDAKGAKKESEKESEEIPSGSYEMP